MAKKTAYKACFGQIFAISLMTSCGEPAGGGKAVEKKSLNSASAPASIDAQGDDCESNSVATSVPGVMSRIALHIEGASPETHALAYVSAQDLHVTFNEVVLRPGASPGKYEATLVLMDRDECFERGGSDECRQVGARMPSDPGFGVHKVVTFIVTSTANGTMDTSTLGRGQNGMISDLLNGEGFIGKIAGVFTGAGGLAGGGAGTAGQTGEGGLLSKIGGIAGTAEEARNSGLNQRPTVLPGGCTEQANVPTAAQAEEVGA